MGFWSGRGDEGAEAERVLLCDYGGLARPGGEAKECDVPAAWSDVDIGDGHTIHTVSADMAGLTIPHLGRPAVVLCHGYGSGVGFFYRNIGGLARRLPGARVHAPDWLGMGLSSRPPFPRYVRAQPHSPDAAISFFLDAFEKWRCAMGIEQMALVGHSLGGYLGALYALRHPQRVLRLVLASPVGIPKMEGESHDVAVTGTRMPRWLSLAWDANCTPQAAMRALGPLGPRFARGFVSRRYAGSVPDADEQAALALYLHRVAAAGPASGEYALAAVLAPGAWAREPLHDHLRALSCPVLFVYGAHDWMDRRHAEAAAAEMDVPVRIESVPAAGHQLCLENADYVNALVGEYLFPFVADVAVDEAGTECVQSVVNGT